jgi:predicted membrane channel-forming protein YqfA (hemolysin III family)
MKASLTRAAATTAVLTAGLLALPLTAMQFTQEVNWGPGDFGAAAALLFGAGMVYHLATRRSRTALQRFAVAALVLAVVGTVWAELAVGLFD